MEVDFPPIMYGYCKVSTVNFSFVLTGIYFICPLIRERCILLETCSQLPNGILKFKNTPCKRNKCKAKGNPRIHYDDAPDKLNCLQLFLFFLESYSVYLIVNSMGKDCSQG